MWAAGWVRGLRGDPTAAADLFRASLSMGRELLHAPLVARSLIGLGRIDLQRGEHRRALAAFAEGARSWLGPTVMSGPRRSCCGTRAWV